MIVGVPCALLSLLQAQLVVGTDLSRPLRARAVERCSRHTPVIFTTEGTSTNRSVRASHLAVYCKMGKFLERVYLGALLCTRERYLCSCFPDIDRQLTLLRVHMYFTVFGYARQQDTQAQWHGQESLDGAA